MLASPTPIQTTNAAPSTSNGFSAGRPTSKNSHGKTMRTATPSAVAPVEIQATGRHRREGSRPCGKSNSKKVGPRTMPGNQIQVPSQAARTPVGSAPGSVTRA